MKVYSWNVNGIRAVHKKGLLLAFLDAHKPDILCLQETKAETGQVEIELPNYREYWNSAVKKGYSGTAIFCKQEPLSVINGFPTEFAKRFSFADELRRDSADELLARLSVERRQANLSQIAIREHPREALVDVGARQRQHEQARPRGVS